MPENHAIVITTINQPTKAVKMLAEGSNRHGIRFILIGDEKSPSDFAQAGSEYFDISAQKKLPFVYAQTAPTKHYARKNVGYLVAIAGGATTIIETDDDNLPIDGFWVARAETIRAQVVSEQGWVNVYNYFSTQRIWPRGLPLQFVKTPPPTIANLHNTEVRCPIQQGLADGDPDVDAVFRLLFDLPFEFEKRPTIALTKDAWCPFNSQNTTWWPAAYELLYLPYYCSFRMTDIWRSFVAQRIAYANDWGVAFHNATVFQERNEHNLIRDFADEISGYLNNDDIKTTLENLNIQSGPGAIAQNLLMCYEALVGKGWIKADELKLLEAWLGDVATAKGKDA